MPKVKTPTRESDRREYQTVLNIGKKYDVPFNITRSICSYPFKYIMDVFNDPYDYKDIYLNGLIRLKLRRQFLNGNKTAPTKSTVRKRYNEVLAKFIAINEEYQKNKKVKTKLHLETDFKHPLSPGDKFMTDYSSSIFEIDKVERVDSWREERFEYSYYDGDELRKIDDTNIVGIVITKYE